MKIVCPTVLARNKEDYQLAISTVAAFASRVHVDLMDFEFAGVDSIAPVQAWWPDGLQVDVHAMLQKPSDHLETLVALGPSMIILHAEASGDLLALIQDIKAKGIKAGIALLPETTLDTVGELLDAADYALVFAGHLGHDGGTADMSQVVRVREIRTKYPGVEIGWDGGLNVSNITAVAESGVDVLCVGGSIRGAKDPRKAYDSLVSLLES